MSPATWPREGRLAERLLHIDPRADRFSDGSLADLPALLGEGDLLVVNDGATMPASLHGASGDDPIELRLISEIDDGRFSALLFGAGDFRTRTEDRPLPPRLAKGARLRFGDALAATITQVSATSARLVEIAFDERGAALWSALFHHGRPIQYAHVPRPLSLWHVQTPYASRPWCAEIPSAGRPLAWGLLLALIRRGVRVAWLTHAAGLSSTGDAALDARLPLPERFEIPEETVRAVDEARAPRGAGSSPSGPAWLAPSRAAPCSTAARSRRAAPPPISASIEASTRGSPTASSPACTSPARATSICSRPSRPPRSSRALTLTPSRPVTSATSSATPA